MEQSVHDEIESAKQLAERKPHLIEAILEERRKLDADLVALGYQPPKKTRKPRKPAAEGSAPQQPKRRRTITG